MKQISRQTCQQKITQKYRYRDMDIHRQGDRLKDRQTVRQRERFRQTQADRQKCRYRDIDRVAD